MSRALLSISLGPVGGFIAAGRRSRDLWWGSAWLSELTIAVATELRQQAGVTLVLPTPERIEAVLAQPSTRHRGRVANKLLFWVDLELPQPRALAVQARNLAHGWLADRIETSLKRPELSSLVNPERSRRQIEAIRAGDFVEIRAGWANEQPAPEGESAWQATVQRATSRRDASPRLFRAPVSDEGVYKCDLDPGRDSVLWGDTAREREARRAERPDEVAARELARRKVGVLKGESLDALYLARRRGRLEGAEGAAVSAELGDLPFPPVGWVAASPWLEGALASRLGWRLERIQTQLDEARHDDDFHAWCSRVKPPSGGPAFGFDPSFLFENGLDALIDGLPDSANARARLMALRRPVEALHRERREPAPYYALIEMDGDGVGAALKSIDDPDVWREIVNRLYQFSDRAAALIEERGGAAFYAAADELMFYTPVDRALCTVEALQEAWASAVRGTLLDGPTSLSAGVVLVHVKDDLEASRRAAHEALSEAKRRRHAARKPDQPPPGAWLCVEERPRAGDGRRVSGEARGLIADLEAWSGAWREERGELSLRTAHILREHLVRLVPKELKEDDPRSGEIAAVARGAILRQLAVNDDTRPSPDTLRGRLWGRATQLTTVNALDALATELLLGARIGRIAAQRDPGPQEAP